MSILDKMGLSLGESSSNSCLILDCGRYPDIHHIMSRGSGAGDHRANCVPLCRMHHTGMIGIHVKGRTRFAKDHPEFKKWLLDHGWEFSEITQKWFLPEHLLREVLRT